MYILHDKYIKFISSKNIVGPHSFAILSLFEKEDIILLYMYNYNGLVFGQH